MLVRIFAVFAHFCTFMRIFVRVFCANILSSKIVSVLFFTLFSTLPTLFKNITSLYFESPEQWNYVHRTFRVFMLGNLNCSLTETMAPTWDSARQYPAPLLLHHQRTTGVTKASPGWQLAPERCPLAWDTLAQLHVLHLARLDSWSICHTDSETVLFFNLEAYKPCLLFFEWTSKNALKLH